MASANNTIKTRIQLKSDTEENWNKSVLTTDAPGIGLKTSGTSFKPLKGELIVYSADATHPFSRLKVGDGTTNIASLPFIDAGTLNGEETEIVKLDNYTLFPSPGHSGKLYVDLSNKTIYHYDPSSGYTQLSQFKFGVETELIGHIKEWEPGQAAKASIKEGVLKLDNGTQPYLNWVKKEVVTNVTQG